MVLSRPRILLARESRTHALSLDLGQSVSEYGIHCAWFVNARPSNSGRHTESTAEMTTYDASGFPESNMGNCRPALRAWFILAHASPPACRRPVFLKGAGPTRTLSVERVEAQSYLLTSPPSATGTADALSSPSYRPTTLLCRPHGASCSPSPWGCRRTGWSVPRFTAITTQRRDSASSPHEVIAHAKPVASGFGAPLVRLRLAGRKL